MIKPRVVGYFENFSFFSDSKIERQTATHSSQMYARTGLSSGVDIRLPISSWLLLQKEHLKVSSFLGRFLKLNTGINPITYAALSTLRSLASNAATRSATSHSRSVTLAATAGVTRNVR